MLNAVLKKESIEEEIDPTPQAKSASAVTFCPSSSSGNGVSKMAIIAAIKTAL